MVRTSNIGPSGTTRSHSECTCPRWAFHQIIQIETLKLGTAKQLPFREVRLSFVQNRTYTFQSNRKWLATPQVTQIRGFHLEPPSNYFVSTPNFFWKKNCDAKNNWAISGHRAFHSLRIQLVVPSYPPEDLGSTRRQVMGSWDFNAVILTKWINIKWFTLQ